MFSSEVSDPMFLLCESAIRLVMKDDFFGFHGSYRFPFAPFVLHLSPVLQDTGFRGFSIFWGSKKGSPLPSSPSSPSPAICEAYLNVVPCSSLVLLTHA